VELPEYQVVAHNTATASTNRIHDDAVARRYGFAGGLVPGVDVYAYLTRAPAAAWGLAWLERGSLRARFVTPVYDGEAVTVAPAGPGLPPRPGEDRCVALELRNPAGVVCATGEAGLLAGPPPDPPGWGWAPVEPATDPPPASPEALAPGTPLAAAPHRFVAARAGEYLASVRETLPLYQDQGVAHPGWLLRDANHLLASNVVLGPWIHVESVVQHHGLVRDGDTIQARGVVTREWERKGHRFVELDVRLVTGGDRLVLRAAHTAIYQPAPRTG
jgi:acyl dehydratase